MPNPIKVLLLASDSYANLRLDREARAVTDAIRRARDRDSLLLSSEWAVTIHNLQDLLLTHRPTVVHFAGHASHAQGIYLSDADGTPCAVDGETLRDLFAVLRGFVRVVVLNACQTLATAEALREVVDYTIGMDAVISDPAAAVFSEAFYGALASGMTVTESFRLGRTRLRMEFKDESHTPHLLIRDGVDPDSYLVPPLPPGLFAEGGHPQSVPKPARMGAVEKEVRDASAFAIACFPGLTAEELDSVVVALLARAPAPPSARWTGSGAVRDGEALLRFWRENGDGILEDALMAGGNDSVPASAARARELALADIPTSAATTRIHTLHRAGLLFAPSEAVATGLAFLSADVAGKDLDSFGGDWLLGVLGETKVPPTQALDRFAMLLLAFHADPALTPAVESAIAGLVRTRAFTQAVGVVTRLRTAPGFDVLPWLRRIADSGGAPVVSSVHDVLAEELAYGARIYPFLRELSGWLPPPGEAADPSPSQRLAMRVLPEYARTVASGLDIATYGRWPSVYPLFAHMRREQLPEQVELLVSWLLHPGLPSAFADNAAADEADRFRAALIAEWIFILCGPNVRQGETPPNDGVEAGPPLPLVAGEVLAALLAEVGAQTQDARGRRLRKTLVAHWEEMRKASGELIPLLGPASGAFREQITWKHDLLRLLVSTVRAPQRSRTAATVPPRSSG